MLIDLHVHSRRTPGCPLDPVEVIRRAEALGLDGVCFTDLDTFAGAGEIHALRPTTRLRLFVGVEVATDHGHYLCFFDRPLATPEPAVLFGPATPDKPWPVREVIEKVRARGGACVAAHPYDRDVPKPAGDFIFTLRGLAAIEGLNGRKRTNVNELAIEAADHLALPCVGGSGAAGSLDELGTAATLFRDPVEDEAGLVAALKAGAVWAVAIGKPPAFGGPGPGARRERHERRDWDRRERDHERGGRDRGRDRRERRGGRPNGRPAPEGRGEGRAAGEARGGEARGGEARGGEARGGEARGGEARGGEARGGEARGGEARGGEARGGEARVPAEPGGGEARSGEAAAGAEGRGGEGHRRRRRRRRGGGGGGEGGRGGGEGGRGGSEGGPRGP